MGKNKILFWSRKNDEKILFMMHHTFLDIEQFQLPTAQQPMAGGQFTLAHGMLRLFWHGTFAVAVLCNGGLSCLV